LYAVELLSSLFTVDRGCHRHNRRPAHEDRPSLFPVVPTLQRRVGAPASRRVDAPTSHPVESGPSRGTAGPSHPCSSASSPPSRGGTASPSGARDQSHQHDLAMRRPRHLAPVDGSREYGGGHTLPPAPAWCGRA
jgi:hypothetical protein